MTHDLSNLPPLLVTTDSLADRLLAVHGTLSGAERDASDRFEAAPRVLAWDQAIEGIRRAIGMIECALVTVDEINRGERDERADRLARGADPRFETI